MLFGAPYGYKLLLKVFFITKLVKLMFQHDCVVHKPCKYSGLWCFYFPKQKVLGARHFSSRLRVSGGRIAVPVFNPLKEQSF